MYIYFFPEAYSLDMFHLWHLPGHWEFGTRLHHALVFVCSLSKFAPNVGGLQIKFSFEGNEGWCITVRS